MMKKTMAVLLAVMMLCFLGATAGNPARAASLLITESAPMNFFGKYLDEGQRSDTTFTLSLGDGLLKTVPEQNKSALDAVKDLLDMLGLRFSSQKTADKAQFGMELLLSDESAIDVKIGLSAAGLLASSNLLGSSPVLITGEQFKSLVDTLGNQLVSQGVVTQEQWNAFSGLLSGDPSALNSLSPMANVDLSGLQAALTAMFSEATQEKVETAPEKLPNAALKMTIPLKKDALANVLAELGKTIWSIPTVKPLFTQSGIQSEADLVEKFRGAADILVEDTAMELYLSESGDSLYMTLPAKLRAGSTVLNLAFEEVVTVKEEAVKSSFSALIRDDAETAQVAIAGEFSVDASGSLSLSETMDLTRDGTTVRMMELNGLAKFDRSETSLMGSGTLTMSVRPDPDENADPQVITVSASGAVMDLGDHAESQLKTTLEMQNLGELFTLNVNAKTVPNPEYIDAAGAVQPLAMSSQEQTDWINSLQTNLMQVLSGVLNKLPAGVQQLIPGMSR